MCVILLYKLIIFGIFFMTALFYVLNNVNYDFKDNSYTRAIYFTI